MRLVLFLVLVALTGCTADRPLRPDEKILSVPETETWIFPELNRPVYVVRTEADVPHVYAHNRWDLAYVQGFVMARDRYFMMDLSRRLGSGTLSELLGEAALANDQEARGNGMAFVAAQIEKGFSPELYEYADAFAKGVNEYIARVARDELPPPSEIDLAFGLLGASTPTDLMKPFDTGSVAAMVAVILYNSSYETGDVGRAATAAQLPTLFEGAPEQALRRAGAIEDLWNAIEPARKFVSAPGMGTFEGYEGPLGTAAGAKEMSATSGTFAPLPWKLPPEMMARTLKRLATIERRLGRDGDGFGSNAWAVAGYASSDGAGLLAGDGHLSLAVPSILYQLGLDTSVFGRGDTHQLGMTIPGFPVVAIGTNGRVAWSQTQLFGDITDWYREELELDADGSPARSLFEGRFRDLERIDEAYEVAPVLGGAGGTQIWSRWQTFDGRFIASIEGRSAAPDEPLAPGETLVNLLGDYVVPGDTDGDGAITAVSFDYAGFDAGHILSATDALGHAGDVYEFRQATRGLVAYSQNFAVADSAGNVLYSAYQAVPCRSGLERQSDGSWAPGADPNLLLDGTRYGAFRIPIEDGIVDEEAGKSDASACVVPFEGTPMSINPAIGHVVTANNDPGGMSLDRSLTNDAHYIGGPWLSGFRALTIATELERAIAEARADVAAMAEIQGNHFSPVGEYLLDDLLASVEHARALPSAPTDPADQRLAALYQSDKEAIDEAQSRMEAWRDRGFQAESGVETFYATPTDLDRQDAVATMIFNAWMSRVLAGVFDDEMLPGVFRPSGTHGRLKGLHQFLRGRGADNPQGLASFNPTTQESVFFDVIDTPEMENSHEVIVEALVDALAFLRSAPSEDEPATGGFGTADMNQWLWGLRHYVRFTSLLDDFLGEDSEYSALTSQFSIKTTILPLTDEPLPPNDPRAELEWFPRDGDQYGVDAANPGTSGTRFHYGDGPVMRMVVALKGDRVWGRNILPGGQSALIDSPHFADQARLWLGNDTLPLRFSVDDVVAGASGRESYAPH